MKNNNEKELIKKQMQEEINAAGRKYICEKLNVQNMLKNKLQEIIDKYQNEIEVDSFKKELLEKFEQEKLFLAQLDFHEEKDAYQKAVHNYYKRQKEISAQHPKGDAILEIYLSGLLKANAIDELEIKNYNDSRVWGYLISNIDRWVSAYKNKKDIFKSLNPNDINSLSIAVAASRNNHLLRKIVSTCAEPDYISPIIEPIIQDTYGAIVFEEQVNEIIDFILDTNEYEKEMFYETLYKTYRLTALNYTGNTISLIDQIKKLYCDIYIEDYKTPYSAFISAANEKGIEENKAKELFNLLLAYFIDNRHRYRNEKILVAKQLYKIAFIELNYPNKPSGVKNEN